MLVRHSLCFLLAGALFAPSALAHAQPESAELPPTESQEKNQNGSVPPPGPPATGEARAREILGPTLRERPKKSSKKSKQKNKKQKGSAK